MLFNVPTIFCIYNFLFLFLACGHDMLSLTFLSVASTFGETIPSPTQICGQGEGACYNPMEVEYRSCNVQRKVISIEWENMTMLSQLGFPKWCPPKVIGHQGRSH